jgi:hypothetical protein
MYNLVSVAQHVSDVTAPIIRSTTVVWFTFSAIGFGFWSKTDRDIVTIVTGCLGLE